MNPSTRSATPCDRTYARYWTSASKPENWPRGLDTWTVYNVIWTSMHGVAAQYVCDRFPPFDPDEYARVMVDLVIAGLKAGTLNGVRLFDMADGDMSPAARKKWLAAGRKKR